MCIRDSGGTPEKIKETITLGRIGNMPPMAAAVGSADDVKNVAQYVLSLSGSPHDSARAALGKEKFAVCAACHGADGKGMPVSYTHLDVYKRQVLWHVHLRRTDDGHQDRECPVALHRLDRRSRSLRCFGLGGYGHYWLHVLPDSEVVRPKADVQCLSLIHI